MMNIKELSVGNWVYNKHHGKAIQITPFDFFTHTHRNERQYLIGIPSIVSGKDFEPIPITPEILEKNGFELSEFSAGYLNIGSKRIVVEMYESGTDLRIFEHYENLLPGFEEDLVVISVRISGVHQLQNALTLCGIEIPFTI